MASRPARRSPKLPPAPPAVPGWEQRSASRVLDAARRRTLERSRRIVRAALAILAEEGLDALTVQKVVERTGLSLRAFYQRFAGKDELLLAVMEETMREAALSYRQRTAEIREPLERLRFIVGDMFAAALSGAAGPHHLNTVLSREHLRLAESHPRELALALAPLDAMLEGELAAGMERGSIRRADPARLARMLHNLLSATIHGALLGQMPPSEVSACREELWSFCRRALETREEEA